MKTIQKFTFSALAAAVLFGLNGCAGMSAQDENTAIGGVTCYQVNDKNTASGGVPEAAVTCHQVGK